MINSRDKFINFLEIKFQDKMYGKHPYIVHLLNVEKVAYKYLSKYPRYSQISLACLGHDVLEDTDATKKDLEALISSDIIDLIDRVTDKEGKNRRERHLNTYAYIRENEEAVLVKLCDRISNIEESLKNQKENKKSMYKKEYSSFKFALYDPRHSIAKKLWDVYDDFYKKL